MNSPDLISNTRESQQLMKQNSPIDLMKTEIIKKSNVKGFVAPAKPPTSPKVTKVNSTETADVEVVLNNERAMIIQSKSIDNINVLTCNNQIKELHTVLHDKDTPHSDFKFYSDRLIRLVVEEGLNLLPYYKWNIKTPGGCEYNGVKNIKGICGVSIMRSGEAMEKGLRECCRCIRIGKILIQTADEACDKSVIYSKFTKDVSSRKILLMYPITTTGSTVNLAIAVLKEHGVSENNIILLCLFATPAGLQSITNKFKDVHIITSEIHSTVPTDFGARYFATE